jgi:hypothetical protein
VVESAERLSEGDAVCQVESHKVWGKYANRRTGITATRFGDRIALGVALGNTPHILVVEPSAEAKLIRVPVAKGSALAKDLTPAQGTRDLQRVTPALVDGRLSAYVDYRDKLKAERRRIVCGAADGRRLLAFDGKPLVDTPPKAAPAASASGEKPAPNVPASSASPASPQASAAEAPPAAASAPAPAASDAAAQTAAPAGDAGAKGGPANRLRVIRDAVRTLKSAVHPLNAPPKPGKTSAPSKAAAPGTESELPKQLDKPVTELRDCRSFVAADGRSAWAIGSELRGEPQAGKVKWSMDLIALPAAGAQPVQLHSVALPDEPKQLHTFESPAAEQLRDGSFALAARYRGALLAWLLNSGKARRGGVRMYAGGYPTLVHFVPDGMDYILITSQQTQNERFELKFGRIDGNATLMPSSLSKPALEGTASLAEPSLARVGKQRWLSYQAGERREGQLTLVPVDHLLNAVGRAYPVTEGQRTVYESLVLALAGDRLLAVFLQNSDAGAELVSEVLHCSARS